MEGLQEQVKAWATKFGVQPAQVEAGIGAVLGFIQSKVPPQQFQQLQNLVPAAQQWIQKAAALPASAAAQGGSAAGGLIGMAGGLLNKVAGGAQGGLGQVLAQLQAAGFRPETAMQFVPQVVNQLKAAIGPEKFDQLLQTAPALKDALTNSPAGAMLGKLLGGNKP